MAKCYFEPNRFMLKRRNAVLQFSKVMELKLQDNDHKGVDGWLNETETYLFDRLDDETKELAEAVTLHNDNPSKRKAKAVMEEAVDVANFAMMVYDRVRYDYPNAG
jgi:hypothetical protein